MDKKILLLIATLVCLFTSCSSQKDTFMNRLYHNTTARFNAYYLSREKVDDLEKQIKENHQEDFSEVLPVFYPIDSAVIQENEDLIQEARDLASKAIGWHKISRWVDPSYFLLGKLDYYQAEFDEAMNTFKYLNVNSKQNDIRHLSLIQLLRIFIDLRQFDDAAYVIDFLSKEPGINKENMQYLYKTLAYYYEVRGEQNLMVTALDKALDNTSDKKERSRLNFMMGQLYQRAGMDALAYDYYQKSLSGNPPYERTFFARLYSQQVVELEKSRDFRRVRGYYDDLYKDRKNVDLRDVILYEKALFERRQGELEEAVRLLNQAAEEPGKNPRQKGYIYRTLAEIFFEEKKDYSATQQYLKLALENFKESDRPYSELALQKEVLDEYVRNYTLIQQNDSLLNLSQMSLEEQEAYVDQFIKLEEERLLREAEEASTPQSTGLFNGFLAFGGGGSGSTFYWDNALAMQRGALEFSRVWGNRPLEDNWRRSNKGFQTPVQAEVFEQEQEISLKEEEEGVEPAITVVLPDRESLLKNIPTDASRQEQMRSEMEEAYFNLGKLLFFDLNEPAQAIAYLEKLVQEYPETGRLPEAYYTLYLAEKEINGNPSRYAERLKAEFPESQFTKSLNNPGGATGSEANLAAAHNYREAYGLYGAGEYQSSKTLIRQTLDEYPLTEHTERLQLLDIMISGKIDTEAVYKSRLENYLQNAEDQGLRNLAGNMLAVLTGSNGGETEEEPGVEESPDPNVDENDPVDTEIDSADEEDPPYTYSPSQTHIFVLALEAEQAAQNKNLTADLENFHQQQFPNDRLRTGNISFTRENSIVIISPFSNAEKALAYREEFLKSFNNDSLSEELKLSSFVISIENFQQFNKRKNIEEYRAFYQESYE